uniref:UEV domain-containing protein n=1 Tax=Ascaris lumbricoides TaxID=6252 RepID=A0A0M3IRU6_ASCLU
MPTLEANVGFLLARVNAKYPKAAKKDILSALSKFNDLHPSVKNFSPIEGKCKKLTFRLKGTISIVYKGNAYNIPLTIFLLNTHPYYAPECFVCPTKNMILNQSEIVDRNGRIRLPYLTNWRHPEYDLSGLLQVCTTFAEIISLRQTYNELKKGIKILKSMLQQLDAEEKQIMEIIAVYKAKRSELKALMDSKEIENLDIDTVIDAPTPLHRQLLRCHAFDISINDTIFVLDEALRCGRITTNVYFKQIRNLSSKQFLARVTVLKCRRKANLPV